MIDCSFKYEQAMFDDMRKLVQCVINESHDNLMDYCDDFIGTLCSYVSLSVAERMKQRDAEITGLKDQIRLLERRLSDCEREVGCYTREKQEYWDKVTRENEAYRIRSGRDDYERQNRLGRYSHGEYKPRDMTRFGGYDD